MKEHDIRPKELFDEYLRLAADDAKTYFADCERERIPCPACGCEGSPLFEKHLLNLYKWYSANKNNLHPFELAVLIHGKLAWIHPFEDGNGRTARAVMNWILIEKGYPMFFIPYETKEKYYFLLEEFDKNSLKEYVSGMLRLIIDQVKSYGHKDKKE